jgi:hypothetical protein
VLLEDDDIVYAADTDGMAIQNGGINRPQEARMRPGIYYRFFSSQAFNAHGAKALTAGGWWLDFEGYHAIRSKASRDATSLAQAARWVLAIPPGWGDCAFVGKAMMESHVKAYVGTAKPAADGISPHSALRDRRAQPVYMPAPLDVAKQWFVPGERDLLQGVFSELGYVQCTVPGIAL